MKVSVMCNSYKRIYNFCNLAGKGSSAKLQNVTNHHKGIPELEDKEFRDRISEFIPAGGVY